MTINGKKYATFNVSVDKNKSDSGNIMLKPEDLNLFGDLESAREHIKGDGFIIDLSRITKEEWDSISLEYQSQKPFLIAQ